MIDRLYIRVLTIRICNLKMTLRQVTKVSKNEASENEEENCYILAY